jgi:hypothetical protein
MTALAEATDVLGDRAAAASIAEQLQPFTGRIAALSATVVSTVDFVLAQMALVTGDHQRAGQHAEQAVGASRKRRTPISSAGSCSDSPPPVSISANPPTAPTISSTRPWRSPTEPAPRSFGTRLGRLGREPRGNGNLDEQSWALAIDAT